ncbi:glycosyltransferase [Azospirillum halopraeferens]|uniref:glycosyltransferase n=1 Tax=Azospirillum halopraeferens TaxID=34010 RepID=UPI00040E5D26|nr:glycosyltransferase [Azospirillum halopraeferens]
MPEIATLPLSDTPNPAEWFADVPPPANNHGDATDPDWAGELPGVGVALPLEWLQESRTSAAAAVASDDAATANVVPFSRQGSAAPDAPAAEGAAILNAARTGDTDRMRDLIAGNPVAADSALSVALAEGAFDIVEFMIGNGAPMPSEASVRTALAGTTPDGAGAATMAMLLRGPLNARIASGDAQRTAALLAWPGIRADLIAAALQPAIAGDSAEPVAAVLKAGLSIVPDLASALLVEAARFGRPGLVQTLLGHGAAPGYAGGAAMIAAAAHGHAAVLRSLHGVDPALTGRIQMTLLNTAAANGHMPIIMVLKECGIDLVAIAGVGVGAAKSCGQDRIAEFLVRLGAVAGLDDAVRANEMARVLDILASGAADHGRINRAFLVAAEHGHAVIAQALIQKGGANVRVDDNAAAILAASKGHTAALEVIHRFGGDIFAHGFAPLRAAAAGGHVATVRYLLENGSGGQGDAALAAAANGQTDTARLLYEVEATEAARVGDFSRIERLHAAMAPDAVLLKRAANGALFPGHADFVRSVIEIVSELPDAAAPDPRAVAAMAEPSAYPRRTVAILMPNYNHQHFLPLSLQGACGQTRPADEVLVLDDGSSDRSLDVIRMFARCYPQIRIIENRRNRGLTYSINKLLHEAKSEYIVCAAADDRLLPEFLNRSMAVLERNPQEAMCFSHLVIHQTNGEVSDWSANSPDQFGCRDVAGFIPLPPSALLDRFKRRGYMWMTSNAIVAKLDAMLACGGFRPDQEWHSDWFTYYAIAFRYGVIAVPETLAIIRANPGGYSDAGMHNPARQNPVLLAIADALKAPENRDLLRMWRRTPAVLSVLGTQLLAVVARTPRHWDIAVPLGWWWLRRRRRESGKSWTGFLSAAVASGIRSAAGRLAGAIPGRSGPAGG